MRGVCGVRGGVFARHERHAHVADLQPLHAQAIARQCALGLARRPAAPVHEERMLYRRLQLHLETIHVLVNIMR